MTIYIVYFFLIILIPNICSSIFNDRKRGQTTALKILMLLMYFILALKAETVGSDIPAYKEWYETTKIIPFNDFSYCYMENGYLLLMKLAVIVGLSFQSFTAFVYALSIIPLYYLIKNKSMDVMLSVLVLFCLEFFVFSCSGLRQTIAMSLCVSSFLILTRSNEVVNNRTRDKIIELFLSILVVLIASAVHRSALLFIPVLFIIFFQYKILTYLVFLGIVLLVIVIPNYFIALNSAFSLSKYEYDERLTLGLMFVFDVVMFLFYLISVKHNRNRFPNKKITWQYGSILFYGLTLMVAFNGSILMRAATYELIFLAVIMPNAIQSWDKSSRIIIKTTYVLVLFYCLYYLVLDANSLSIVPYKFFFEI